MIQEDIDRLRRLERAATPGPWFCDSSGVSVGVSQGTGWADRGVMITQDDLTAANADLIAALRNACLPLLDELDRRGDLLARFANDSEAFAAGEAAMLAKVLRAVKTAASECTECHGAGCRYGPKIHGPTCECCKHCAAIKAALADLGPAEPVPLHTLEARVQRLEAALEKIASGWTDDPRSVAAEALGEGKP